MKERERDRGKGTSSREEDVCDGCEERGESRRRKEGDGNRKGGKEW